MSDFEGVIQPPEERGQHERVARAAGQVVDAAGLIGDPWQAETLLAKLERRGDIDHNQRQAGERFHRLFQRAALDPLRAADMGRIPGHGSNDRAHEIVQNTRQIRAVVAILGGNASLAGSIAWSCLGEGHSIRRWAIERGRREEVAKGILIATLAQLAIFWGSQ